MIFVCGRLRAELWETTRAEWLERSRWAAEGEASQTAAAFGDFAPG